MALLNDETAGERYVLAVETSEDGSLCPVAVQIAAAGPS